MSVKGAPCVFGQREQAVSQLASDPPDNAIPGWVVNATTNFHNNQGAVLIRKTVLPGMAIPMLKIRRPNGRLIFNMEIAIRR